MITLDQVQLTQPSLNSSTSRGRTRLQLTGVRCADERIIANIARQLESTPTFSDKTLMRTYQIRVQTGSLEDSRAAFATHLHFESRVELVGLRPIPVLVRYQNNVETIPATMEIALKLSKETSFEQAATLVANLPVEDWILSIPDPLPTFMSVKIIHSKSTLTRVVIRVSTDAANVDLLPDSLAFTSRTINQSVRLPIRLKRAE